MGLSDLLTWTLDRVRTDDPAEVDEARARRLAERASDDSVRVDVLDGSIDVTKHPLLAYVEDDERPEYVFRGSRLLVSDGDSLSREHPARELAVVITDRRVLFVVGNRLADDVLEIPLDDVALAYVDDEELRRYFVVESRREGAEMTFFADVTGDDAAESHRDAVDFIERAGTDSRRDS